MAGIKVSKITIKHKDQKVEMSLDESLDLKKAWFDLFPEPSPLVHGKQVIPRHLPLYIDPEKEYVHNHWTVTCNAKEGSLLIELRG